MNDITGESAAEPRNVWPSTTSTTKFIAMSICTLGRSPRIACITTLTDDIGRGHPGVDLAARQQGGLVLKKGAPMDLLKITTS